MKRAVVLVALLMALSVYIYLDRIRPARQHDATLRGSGTVEAIDVSVSPKLAARILKINVEEGARVVKGQELAALDCEDVETRVKQAEAQVAQARAALAQSQASARQVEANRAPLSTQRAQAERDVARAVELKSSNSIALSQLETAQSGLATLRAQETASERAWTAATRGAAVAEAQVEVALSALRNTQVARKECTLLSPVDGTVMARNYEPGELALPGSSLLVLNDLREVFTWIYIPNEEIGRVRLGAEVSVKADTYPGRRFTGRVARINAKAEFTPKSIQTKEDRTRLVYGVKVQLANEDAALMPGMPVEAAFVAGEK